jgi:predicted SAM-dependent methyltransferase
MQMRKTLKGLRKSLKLQLSCLRRRCVKPTIPKNADGEVLIHIGCGEKNSPEFINVDARPLAHIHIATDDITSLDDFQSGTVDLVYMCHILEHIKKDGLKDVLLEMKRVLKDGGVLRISVPDFDKLIEVYNASAKDINAISNQLMGGQDHEYNVHYTVFNHRRLSELLQEVGFSKVVPWDPDNCQHHDFKDRASRTMKVNGKEIMISLNLEAIK